MDTNRTPLTARQVLLRVLVLEALIVLSDQKGALQKAERLSTQIARNAGNDQIAALATRVTNAIVDLQKSRGMETPHKEDLARLLVRLEAEVRAVNSEPRIAAAFGA